MLFTRLALAGMAASILEADTEAAHRAVIEAIKAAKVNVATSAGRQYDATVATYFGTTHDKSMRECFRVTESPDTRNFDLVVKLAGDGKPGEVLVWPETNIALCLRDAVKKQDFPAPPSPSYWAHFDIRLAP